MSTKQRKIKGDRPIEPENDDEQKREAMPRVTTVRRLIERDRPGAGTLTLADYVAAGYDSPGSIAAASRRVREQAVSDWELGTRDWSVVPGGRSWGKIEDWMTAMARSAAGPGRGGSEGLIKGTLTYWELDENSAEYGQVRQKAEELMAQYASRRQPASRGDKEARAQLHHGLITYDVPVCAVLHVTDDSLGHRVAQGRSDWFSISDAESHARSASMAAAPPQRYLVYDENEALVSIWQSGQKMSMFTVAAKRSREADVTGEQRPDSSKEARARERASMSARARRMAAAAHRAKRPARAVAQDMGDGKWSYSTKEELAERIGMFQAAEFFLNREEMQTKDVEGSPVRVYSEEDETGSVIVEVAEARQPVRTSFDMPSPADEGDEEWLEQEYDDLHQLLDDLSEIEDTDEWDYELEALKQQAMRRLDYLEEAKRPVTEGARGPVEGEMVWLSKTGQEMTIQEIDWPKEVVVLTGAGDQQVVPVASLRYFGSSGIDWMCDVEGDGTETEEGVRRYRITAGDRELMTTSAHSLDQATEIAEEILAEGDRAAYIAWQDEGQVEEAGDPTLVEAFAWAGPLAAGAATGRVDAAQTDPGLSALIETLGQEVKEARTLHLETEEDWEHARQWMQQNYMGAKDRVQFGSGRPST